MRGNESKLWQRINLIQKTKKRWHLMRIESSTINGIPDVNACIEDCEFWLELKANEAKNCGLSKYQINWHLKRQRAGGKCFILNQRASLRVLELLQIREPGIPFPVSRFIDNPSGLLKALVACGPDGQAAI
tara:strand:+ start:2167 stop:2559 length:393 start_codon:yes stop_codon:yes gene_type:complete